MVQHTKSQRRPVTVEIKGEAYQLLAVGSVARALHRCVWTVGYWERIHLLPEPAVVWYQGDPYTRRRLYFTDYVEALSEIAQHGYMTRQLLREDQLRFQAEAWEAYQTLVVPITGLFAFQRGVMVASRSQLGLPA